MLTQQDPVGDGWYLRRPCDLADEYSINKRVDIIPISLLDIDNRVHSRFCGVSDDAADQWSYSGVVCMVPDACGRTRRAADVKS